MKKSKKEYSILLIKDIDNISIKEQLKFIEILKYKKIITFDIPNNYLIIVTCSNKNGKINEKLYSLLADI